MFDIRQARLLAVCALGLTGLLNPLKAETRDWLLQDNKTVLSAELVNAFGDEAYFKKADGKFVHLPVTLLAPNEMARVIVWARERDAKPAEFYYSSQGPVVKNIMAQWPNRVVSGEFNDKENISNLPVPKVFVFIMAHQCPYDILDTFAKVREVEEKVNGKDGHFMETVVISSATGEDMDSVRASLKRAQANWLMPNEWAFKDKQSIWNPYWRNVRTAILIVDADGTMLLDSSVSDKEGHNADPIAFLKKLAAVADNMRAGGFSVDNPLVNRQALQARMAADLAAKANRTRPEPVVFNFSGMDPADLAALDGKTFKVEMEVGVDGLVRRLSLKDSADPHAEAALRQASALWFFLPVAKDGVPEAKTIIVPMPIHAPKAAPAAK